MSASTCSRIAGQSRLAKRRNVKSKTVEVKKKTVPNLLNPMGELLRPQGRQQAIPAPMNRESHRARQRLLSTRGHDFTRQASPDFRGFPMLPYVNVFSRFRHTVNVLAKVGERLAKK